MSRYRTRPVNRSASPIRDRHDDARHRRHDQRVIAAYHAETARRSRVRTVELVLAGCHVGRIPFGYRATSRGRRSRAEGTDLAIEPIEAATVAMMFSWRTRDRLGLTEIARRLNAARYPRPVHSATLLEVGWTSGRVAAILANPVYTGRSVWGRTRDGRPAPVELWVLSGRREYVAVVSDDEFLAAQHDAARRSALAIRFTGRVRAAADGRTAP